MSIVPYHEALADTAAKLIAGGTQPERAVRVALHETFDPGKSREIVSAVLSILGKRGAAARNAKRNNGPGATD